MDDDALIRALAALAQPSRLALFEALVRAGPSGLAAGTLGAMLDLPSPTLAFHLGELKDAGLVRCAPFGRQRIYTPDLDRLRALVARLAAACCEGRPELCDLATPSPERTMNDRVFNVLFLCTANSARSIMAECILDRLAPGRFKAFSAGSHPKGEVNPYTIELLRRFNYRTEGLRSKDWAEFAGPDAPPLDFVFTVCDRAAGEVCPIWPGQPMTAHWGFPDPAEAKGTEDRIRRMFHDVYRQIEKRLSIFVNLPLESLDRLALQRRLDELGRPLPRTA